MQNNPFRFKIFENTCKEMTWFPFTSGTAGSISMTAYLGPYCIFEAPFHTGIDYLTEYNLYCKSCPLLPVFLLNSSNIFPLKETDQLGLLIIHILYHICNMLVPHLHPQVIIFLQDCLLFLPARAFCFVPSKRKFRQLFGVWVSLNSHLILQFYL